MESFYHDLHQTLKKPNKEDIVIVMGDFDAKLGKGNTTEYIGILWSWCKERTTRASKSL